MLLYFRAILLLSHAINLLASTVIWVGFCILVGMQFVLIEFKCDRSKTKMLETTWLLLCFTTTFSIYHLFITGMWWNNNQKIKQKRRRIESNNIYARIKYTQIDRTLVNRTGTTCIISALFLLLCLSFWQRLILWSIDVSNNVFFFFQSKYTIDAQINKSNSIWTKIGRDRKHPVLEYYECGFFQLQSQWSNLSTRQQFSWRLYIWTQHNRND